MAITNDLSDQALSEPESKTLDETASIGSLQNEMTLLRSCEQSHEAQLLIAHAQSISVLALLKLRQRQHDARESQLQSDLTFLSRELKEKDRLLDDAEKARNDAQERLNVELGFHEASGVEERLRAENEALRVQMEDRNAQMDRLRSNLDRMSSVEQTVRSRNEELCAQLKDRDTRVDALESNLNHVSDVAEMLRAENEELRARLDHRYASVEELQSAFDRVSKQLEEKTRLLDECEKSRKNVEERLQSSISNIKLLESKVEALKLRLIKAELEFSCLEDLRNQVKDLTERLKTAYLLCGTLAEELELRKEKDARREEREKEALHREETGQTKKASRKSTEDPASARKETERQRRVEVRRAREQAQREQEKAQEEREKEKLENARLAEEQEKQRLEKEKWERERAWKAATEAELLRCRERDAKLLGFSQTNLQFLGCLWTPSTALARFDFMIKEFETIKFSVEQPLTFENVPWPTLVHPYAFKLEDIAWKTVETFFEITMMLMDSAQYKALVEKAHRLFHPDRWRSRNLLKTVMDEELRKSLEVAGNTVSQAITPVWRKSLYPTFQLASVNPTTLPALTH